MAGISRRFGAVQALSGVDLTVAAGEVVALAGENGSGKSTLSRILSGVLTPDSGSVHLGDARCSFSHPRQALDAGITMVSQEPTSVPHLSVAENVLLPRLHRAAQRVSRRELIRDAAPFLQRVGLMVDPARMLGSLGQGERELVELAKAIAVHPHILVLDEVTTRLPDPERLFRVVDELAASGWASCSSPTACGRSAGWQPARWCCGTDASSPSWTAASSPTSGSVRPWSAVR